MTMQRPSHSRFSVAKTVILTTLLSVAAPTVHGWGSNSGVYLANCNWLDCSHCAGRELACCFGGSYSCIFYTDTENGNGPVQWYTCDGVNTDHYITWEGGLQARNLNSGDRFTWSINADAQNQPDGTDVGSGFYGMSNGDGHGVRCFKGDKHLLTASSVETTTLNGAGAACSQIYYCHCANPNGC
ncbi:hypothetical protein DFJ73DRAFT_831619 [Zopfochytrium polystomum]|nr:hypothetical protein DFJ73DRAFT_831619 [Zopfochytrium polystomum]